MVVRVYDERDAWVDFVLNSLRGKTATKMLVGTILINTGMISTAVTGVLKVVLLRRYRDLTMRA